MAFMAVGVQLDDSYHMLQGADNQVGLRWIRLRHHERSDSNLDMIFIGSRRCNCTIRKSPKAIRDNSLTKSKNYRLNPVTTNSNQKKP
uniref:Uncharacterized protein n=1 Tax=Heterorhabditis bacteriophora TaxID=37862 RepID=A0A1I7WK92_HETBA